MSRSSPRALLFRPACAVAAAAALACAAGAGGERIASSPPTGTPQDPPAVVLARFVDALDAGRWAQAGSLLSARWRAAYTPSRLQADFGGAGPVAREATARVHAAMRASTPLQVEDGRAWLPLAGGRALLVAEEGRWRVDALE